MENEKHPLDDLKNDELTRQKNITLRTATACILKHLSAKQKQNFLSAKPFCPELCLRRPICAPQRLTRRTKALPSRILCPTTGTAFPVSITALAAALPKSKGDYYVTLYYGYQCGKMHKSIGFV